MLGRLCAGCASVALAGCAYISGPCAISASSTDRSAACETGGVLIVMPGSVLRDALEAPARARQATVATYPLPTN